MKIDNHEGLKKPTYIYNMERACPLPCLINRFNQ